MHQHTRPHSQRRSAEWRQAGRANFPTVHEQMHSANRKSTSGGILKMVLATLRECTKGQTFQTLSSGESEYHAAVTTTAEALHLQRLLEFLGMPVKLRLRIDSTAARGIIRRQSCGPLKHTETRRLWLQAKHEERELTVVKEPTQTNTADGFTKALQTAKYWNGGTLSVWDTTKVTVLRRASEKRSQNQDDGHELKRCTRSHAQCCSRP